MNEEIADHIVDAVESHPDSDVVFSLSPTTKSAEFAIGRSGDVRVQVILIGLLIEDLSESTGMSIRDVGFDAINVAEDARGTEAYLDDG